MNLNPSDKGFLTQKLKYHPGNWPPLRSPGFVHLLVYHLITGYSKVSPHSLSTCMISTNCFSLSVSKQKTQSQNKHTKPTETKESIPHKKQAQGDNFVLVNYSWPLMGSTWSSNLFLLPPFLSNCIARKQARSIAFDSTMGEFCSLLSGQPWPLPLNLPTQTTASTTCLWA